MNPKESYDDFLDEKTLNGIKRKHPEPEGTEQADGEGHKTDAESASKEEDFKKPR